MAWGAHGHKVLPVEPPLRLIGDGNSVVYLGSDLPGERRIGASGARLAERMRDQVGEPQCLPVPIIAALTGCSAFPVAAGCAAAMDGAGLARVYQLLAADGMARAEGESRHQRRLHSGRILVPQIPISIATATVHTKIVDAATIIRQTVKKITTAE